MSKSPFKFLDSYTKEDNDIFFGREEEIEEVYSKIFHSRIMLVYGASGTGKSSLISCGLANKFQDSDWLPVNIRRGENINLAVKKQLERSMIKEVNTQKASLTKCLKSVYLDHFKPIYLIFDQFEELFIFGKKEEWDEFSLNIRKILDAEINVKLIFIIRGEYLEYLTEFESVIPEIFNNRIRIEKMTRNKAVNCITGPGRVYNIAIEEGFPEKLLSKLSSKRAEIELTYLQVFLDRIYRIATEKETENVSFSNELLEELGNIGDVLSNFLDEQIEQTVNPEKTLAILKAFVSTDATKKQITTEETYEFVQTLGQETDKGNVEEIILELVNKRILKDKDESGRYELRHDSLAEKIYEKISSFERDLIEVNSFLNYALSEHKKRSFLLNASDLAYISPYRSKLKLSPEMIVFVEKSEKQIQKKKRSRKQFFAFLIVISILFITSIFGLFYSQKQKEIADENALLAKSQTEEAQKQSKLALEQSSLAEKQREEANRQAQIADKQREIALQQSDEAERQRIIATSLRKNAEKERQLAIREKVIADSAKDQAERYSVLASKNLELAEKEKINADRLRILALAQALGAKSSLLQDKEQQILLASQSYYFNQLNDGYPYQSDIYKGVYNAYESVFGEDFNSTKVHQSSVKELINIKPGISVTASSDGKIQLIKASDSKVEAELIDEVNDLFISLAYNKLNNMVATGTETGRIIIYDLSNNKKIQEIQTDKGPVWSICWAGEDNLLFGGGTGDIFQMNKDNQDIKKVIETSSIVNTIKYSSGQQQLFAGLNSGQIGIYHVQNNYNLISNLKTMGPVTGMSVSKSGSLLSYGTEDGSVVIWSIERSETVQSLRGHLSMISDLKFSSDEKFLVSSSYDGTAMIWNIEELNRQQIILKDHGAWVLAADFDLGAKKIYTGDADGQVRVFSYQMKDYASELCGSVDRQLTQKEWDNYVGNNLPFDPACSN